MATTSSLSEMFPRMAMRAAFQSRSATPLARSMLVASRTFSTATRQSPLVQSAKAPRPSIVSLVQQRTLFGSSWGQNANRNMLAYLEQTANNNPGSATAQNAFYQALLRSNMPEILVERYNTGHFATNTACDNVYGKALERIGAAESGGLGGMAGRNMGVQGQNQGMTPEQLQAIGQAVSARTNGGNVSMARNGPAVSGAKGEPMYVVVDESLRAYIFRWVKFIAIFALSVYCALVVITLFIEATGVLKKVSGASSAETKAEQQKTRFSDVHGCDEAKEELQEVVDFLKNPDQYSALGGKLPKGVLLSGPPGTGKTLLARAVAGEAGVPFFYMSGSEFDEMYVGVGAKRVRELFASARGKAPAIVFLDELDAMGGKRNDRDAAYARQTLNQLLTELDGFDQDTGVIVIGATNFPEALDNALTRPGRFDRNIVVPLPDVRGRIAILDHHLKNIKIGPDVETSVLARAASGFSGADIENLCNQAATHASKRKSAFVTLEDMTWALDKIYMGAERRSAVIQQKDKIMTAYHEAGHALVAMLSPASDPLYKATIMPRGHALGITFRLPEMDQVSRSRRQLMADIDVCMGGKAAEELIYGRDYVTTGASSDIQQATSLARHMVTQAGMSELVGNVDISGNYNKLSMQTRQDVDAEVRRFVEEGRVRVEKLLRDNRQSLERIALGLVEYETLNKDEMEKLVRGESLGDKLKVNLDANIKMPELVKPSQVVLGPQNTDSSKRGDGGQKPYPA